MAATLEIKYFNSYWMKKITSVVAPTGLTPPYAQVPQGYPPDNNTDWFIEESRIRGGYNNVITDVGVKAHIVEDNPNNQNRFNSMIYSGVFNSRTGINQTNEFSVAEDITRSVDPAQGSIQRLYAEDTNLIIFQEDKINRALIDKDAIFTAEGGRLTTSGAMIIGQIVPFKGEYGIAKDPGSFAVYGFRKYFTDRKRACVLRLDSSGKIEEISSYGMHDFFRDELTQSNITNITGGWDNHTKNYIISIQKANKNNTVSFDESVKGWTSFLTFKPSTMFSLAANFFSTNSGKLYKHHDLAPLSTPPGGYGQFYTITSNSTVKVVLNKNPSTVKVFQTIGYEGNKDWTVTSIVASSGDIGLVPVSKYFAPTNPAQLEAEMFTNSFKRKENKFFANIINNSPATQGEIIFGASMTGVKGFFNTFEFTLDNSINEKRELFAVSSDTVESSY